MAHFIELLHDFVDHRFFVMYVLFMQFSLGRFSLFGDVIGDVMQPGVIEVLDRNPHVLKPPTDFLVRSARPPITVVLFTALDFTALLLTALDFTAFLVTVWLAYQFSQFQLNFSSLLPNRIEFPAGIGVTTEASFFTSQVFVQSLQLWDLGLTSIRVAVLDLLGFFQHRHRFAFELPGLLLVPVFGKFGCLALYRLGFLPDLVGFRCGDERWNGNK